MVIQLHKNLKQVDINWNIKILPDKNLPDYVCSPLGTLHLSTNATLGFLQSLLYTGVDIKMDCSCSKKPQIFNENIWEHMVQQVTTTWLLMILFCQYSVSLSRSPRLSVTRHDNLSGFTEILSSECQLRLYGHVARLYTEDPAHRILSFRAS